MASTVILPLAERVRVVFTRKRKAKRRALSACQGRLTGTRRELLNAARVFPVSTATAPCTLCTSAAIARQAISNPTTARPFASAATPACTPIKTPLRRARNVRPDSSSAKNAPFQSPAASSAESRERFQTPLKRHASTRARWMASGAFPRVGSKRPRAETSTTP